MGDDQLVTVLPAPTLDRAGEPVQCPAGRGGALLLLLGGAFEEAEEEVGRFRREFVPAREVGA
ncbi:hypothetical protein FHX79_112490 [Streptomyces cavourensis]|nr:hypothetical protein FHX79_112490 [Streptomyces cavourensis]GGU87897.1 hypothetical protein GCM10010498_53030 [Streptomyces cavourensis]